MTVKGNCAAALLCVPFILGGCYKTATRGEPDADADAQSDPVDRQEPDTACPDRDGDGFTDAACGGEDCDDTRNDVFPGASDVCFDGVDNDCDGWIDGPWLLQENLCLSRGDQAAESPVLVWTGSEFVAAWVQSGQGAYGIHLAAVGASGDRVEWDTAVAELNGGESEPALVWTGSELGLAWESWQEELSEIYFTRLGAAGERLMDSVRITMDPWLSSSPHMSWTGSEFAIAWVDSRLTESRCTMMGCAYDIFFARVSAQGEKIGDDVRVSDRTVSPGGYWGPVWTSWTGSELGIFWNMFSRMSPSGMESGPDVDLGHEMEALPAWTGSEYGLLWPSISGDPVGDQGLYFSRLGPGGDERDRSLVAGMENAPGDFSLAWADGKFGVLWRAYEEEGSLVYFATLTAEGIVEGRKKQAASSPVTMISHHALVWTGSEFGLVWSQSTDRSPMAFFTRIGICR
jgi:hypothetical protein